MALESRAKFVRLRIRSHAFHPCCAGLKSQYESIVDALADTMNAVREASATALRV
jgi:hypothetical protein